MAHFISPKYDRSKASPGVFEDWVDIYEDRLWGWHLQHADTLRRQGPDAAIAALHLAVAFIEPYEVFRTGQLSRDKSKQFFRAGFKRIFGQSPPVLSAAQFDVAVNAMYEQVRCGLFHAAMPGLLVYLSNTTPGIQVQMEETTNTVVQIVVNPETFVDAVVAEFKSYVARLRNAAHPEHANLRQNFEQAWHLVHKRTPDAN